MWAQFANDELPQICTVENWRLLLLTFYVLSNACGYLGWEWDIG
jgi:hypothetical protein